LLRIEDLDAGRVRPGFVDELFRDLEYLGLDWDEPPLVQSQRGDVYREALARLEARDQVYPCFCSRAEIARAASAPHGPSDEGPRYPGTCAQLTQAERETRRAQRAPALRFRVGGEERCVDDALLGRYCQTPRDVIGDFVVQKNDGVASYQLAVVVDDAATGITQVLRGEDLLSSTPRQLLLYEALGLPIPQFAHVPLVLGEDGKRLAKREGPLGVATLRESGVPAQRVIGLLAQWSGLGHGEPASARDLVSGFTLAQVRREPPIAREDDVRAALLL
jgi:glutamyl-tRNA synthetase